MTTTNTTTRADDARLHELLTGETCEWRYCAVNECGAWVEQESIYEERGLNHQLQRLVASSGRQICHQGPFGNWLPVPEYHDDDTAMRAAELALPPELQGDYASELINEIVDREDLRGIVPYPTRDEHEKALAYRGIYALITATAQQRAQAMCNVLERARAKEVVK